MGILAAIGIGLLIPAAEQLGFLIRYCLMAMLFFSFLEVRFSCQLLQRAHLVVVVLNLALPLVVGQQAEVEALTVAMPVISIIFLPLLASLALRWAWPAAATRIQRYSGYSFSLFLFNVFVAAASASHFARGEGSSALGLFFGIGLAVALLCLFQFRLGERIGRPGRMIDVGLSLGRKNTMFGIWLALTFISPVAALGPMYYILFQNLYNSWQMYRMQ